MTRYRLSLLSNYVAILLSLTLIFTSGCEFINNISPSPNESDINRSVEATINAEKDSTQAAQLVSNQTASALQATIDAQATSLSQPPIQKQVQTEIPTETVTDTPVVTQSFVETTSIPITDWKMLYWRLLSSGCHFKDQICWKLFDDYKTTQGWAEAVMTSKNPILIEENWPNPYLVYWNERDLRFAARLVLHVDGTPIIVKDLSKSKCIWQLDNISLEDYKGQQVIVQFISNVGEKYISTWFIQDVQIVPDFTP